MNEKQLIRAIFEALGALTDVDRITHNEKTDFIKVEFHDGDKPKRLTISAYENIGLDYGGNFIHKNYKPNRS